MKRCALCGLDKPLSEFPRHKGQPDGYWVRCKPCHNAATKASRDRHGGARRYHLRRRYGIELEDYLVLVEKQGNRCAICGRPDPTHLDHDHAGKADKHQEGERVRGVLCVNCNNGLGHFQDDPVRLRAAAAYLEGGQ